MTDKFDDGSNTFIVSWCEEGLETVQKISDPEKAKMWSVLSGKPVSNDAHMVWAITMRARANSHRHYEVYGITANAGITAEDIADMFDKDPQYAADLIRQKGVVVFSDRRDTSKVLIR